MVSRWNKAERFWEAEMVKWMDAMEGGDEMGVALPHRISRYQPEFGVGKKQQQENLKQAAG